MILDPNVVADRRRDHAQILCARHTHGVCGHPARRRLRRHAVRRPTNTFRVIYIAQDLATGVAETLVRDRFQGRARRKLLDVEAALWGATEVSAAAPLTLIDLRTTGLVRLGVSTEAGLCG